MANRITTLFDLDSKGFDSGLKKLRTEVAKADGPINKLKAAGSGLGSILQANVGAAATAAGAALLTFGVKSVKASQDLTLAAGKFADATGVSMDSASRLIEVAGDLGIETGSVQAAILKMNMAISKGGPTIDKLGDSIVRTKDGTVDSAASFQNLVTTIGAIEDPTQRALAAQQVFGRGYAEIAQMMEMSAGQLAARMASVSDQKLRTDEQRAQAERFRDAMDTLRDRLDDVMLTLGDKLVPVLSDTADFLDNAADATADLNRNFQKLTGIGIVDAFSSMDTTVEGFGRALDGSNNSVDRTLGFLKGLIGTVPVVGDKIADAIPTVTMMSAEMAQLAVDIEAGTSEAQRMAEMYAQRVPPAVEKTTTYVEDLEAAADEAKRAAEELQQQWDSLFDSLDAEQATLDLADQFDQLEEAAITAYAAGVEGADNAVEAQRDHQRAIVATKEEVARYAKEVLGLPPDKVTEILALLDAGEAAKVEQQLATLARYREARIKPIVLPDRIDRVRPTVAVEGVGASGGIVNRPTVALIGEAGPEALVPLSKTPGNGPLPAMGAGAMVVNITTGADPEDVVRAIEKFKRRNGSLPF